ncbi:MAG: hypothetical protein ABJA02_07935 [Acidobacteriota bacterium]
MAVTICGGLASKRQMKLAIIKRSPGMGVRSNVKKTSKVVLGFIVMGLVGSIHAQFPQMRQADERRREMIAADEARQAAEKQGKPAVAAARPVTNVDVQMVLTKNDYKSFAEAKPNAATVFADGDPAWLYIKLNGKLEKYVYRTSDPSGERFLLFVEYGPAGDVTAKSHETIEFSKAELALSEFKMSLAPGKAGHNNALAIYIKNVAVSKPGLWHNELRISDRPGFPRSPGDYLAKTAFNSDFSKGIAKYPAERNSFQSLVLRDSTDESKLPIAGKFDDKAVRTELTNRLTSEGIVPTSIYFSDDFWGEYSDDPSSIRQFRTITATFLYRSGAACMYGTADITQRFAPMNDRFGESTIDLKKDIAIPCSEIK